MRARAKPVEVELYEWRGRITDLPQEWLDDGVVTITETRDVVINTDRGPAKPVVGDYIVRGTQGEYYPISAVVFADKYEVVR